MPLPRNSFTCTMLSQALTALGIAQVAWAGAQGQEHYRMTTSCEASLAEISAWAQEGGELLYLAIGWWRAHSLQDEANNTATLTVVIDSLPPKFWESLDQAQRLGISLMVILIDEHQQYVPTAQGSVLQGYSQTLGITCSNPVDCHSLSAITASLSNAMERPGLRLVHLVGAGEPASPRLYTPFSWDSFRPGPYNATAKSQQSLASSTLDKLVPTLLQFPQVIALWTRSLHPGPLLALGPRLQYASMQGLLWQLAALVDGGYHPLVFLSSNTVPTLVPELMELHNCSITFVILDSCTSMYDYQGQLVPLAKLHDMALLSTIPELIIAEPADEEDACSIISALLRHAGLSVVRLSATSTGSHPGTITPTASVIGQGQRLCAGEDLSFICLGHLAKLATLAVETLRRWDIKAGVYNMRYLRPLDITLLREACAPARIVTVEDHSVEGGLGTAVLETAAEYGLIPADFQAVKVGLDRDFMDCEPCDHSISLTSLQQAAREVLGFNRK